MRRVPNGLRPKARPAADRGADETRHGAGEGHGGRTVGELGRLDAVAAVRGGGKSLAVVDTARDLLRVPDGVGGKCLMRGSA